MAEYIEREAAIRALLNDAPEQVIDWYRPYGQTDEPIPFETLVSDLRDMKAADVAPVRHAKWEVVIGSDGKEHMVCTGCRKQQDLTGVFSYCPNCGCRMDGGDDE